MIEKVDVFLHNLNFVWFNSFLALIPVLFGDLMLKTKRNLLKAIYGFIWLIFLPNTIYTLTDISHLFEDWDKVDLLFKAILMLEYGILMIVGFLTFIYAVYFFEKLLENKNKKRRKLSTYLVVFILNFIVGFGVILGNIQRTNSWYIFTNPTRVINDSVEVFFSPELIFAFVIFGILCNIAYFYFVKKVVEFGRKKLSVGGH